MKHLFVQIALLGLAATATASSGQAYLSIPQGARATGLGTAVTALNGRSEMLWYNPAGINGTRFVNGLVSRMNWLGETRNDFLALTASLVPGQAFGAYVNSLGNDDIYRDSLGNEGAHFQNEVLTVGGAYAITLGDLSLGLAAKYFSESFEVEQGSGYAADLGLQYARGPFRLGLAVQNLGTASINASSSLGSIAPPTTYRAGLAWQHSSIIVSEDLRLLPGVEDVSSLSGIEYGFRAVGFDFAVRGGYDSSGLKIGDLAGLVLGAGARLNELSIDMAWLPEGALGNPFRVSAAWQFAGPPPPIPTPSTLKPVLSEVEPPKGNLVTESKDQEKEPEPSSEEIPTEEKLKPVSTAGPLTTGRLVHGVDPTVSAVDERFSGAQKERDGYDAEALAAYERAVEKDPQDYLNWKALGKLNYKLGNKSAALKAFEMVQELKPTDDFKGWLDKYRKDN